MSNDSDRPRILIVEDERIVAMGLQAQLERLGYTIPALATTGEEAVRRTEELRPDIVLMDIHLAESGMDGVDAAAEIRRRFAIPVVFLSAYSNKEILQRAKITEPYGYILKPYEERELHIVIQMALYKHRMERQVQEREHWVAATLKSIGDGVIATDTQGRITFLNTAAESLTGWKQDEAAGQAETTVFNIVHEQTGRVIESPLKRAILERIPIPLANHTVLTTKDRTQRCIDDCAAPIIDERGNLLGGVLVFRDVTQPKEAEKAKFKLAAIVENSDDAIVEVTLDGFVATWNIGAERLFGYTAAEVVGQSIALLSLPGEAEEWRRHEERLRRGERVLPFETVRRRKNTTEVVVLTSISPILGEDGQVVSTAVVHQDMTQIKQMERQMLQSQKMEAIGRLAGGVAHDFNNLLTVICGYSEMLLKDASVQSTNRGMIQSIHEAGHRAACLTGQLLAFSRKQVIQVKFLNLNTIVTDIEKMLQRLIGEDIRLSVVVDDALRPVKADPGQIEQVIMNLVVNARDAMPQGGRLTIETANAHLDDAYAHEHPEVNPGLYCTVAVADTGIGMDEATKSQIFEPFFTTKEPGKGTGLGLATVYGIVKQSGGCIDVDSEPNHGTTVKVYFPAALDASPSGMPLLGLATMPPGTETLLVVEDDVTVRLLTEQLLQKCGYTVMSVGHGQEAVQLAEKHAGPIHLLIADVVMPNLGGRQLAERLVTLRPEMKVLFVSGYMDDAIVRHGVLEAETACLQKPFTAGMLARKVREVLDQHDR